MTQCRKRVEFHVGHVFFRQISGFRWKWSKFQNAKKHAYEPRRISFFALFILCFFYYTPLAQTRKTAFWKWDQHGLNRIFPENKRDWDFFGKMAKPGSHREKNGAKCARLGPFWVRLFRPLLLWWRLFAEYYIPVTGGAKYAIWTQKKVQYINEHEITRLKTGWPTGFREKKGKKTGIYGKMRVTEKWAKWPFLVKCHDPVSQTRGISCWSRVFSANFGF